MKDSNTFIRWCFTKIHFFVFCIDVLANRLMKRRILTHLKYNIRTLLCVLAENCILGGNLKNNEFYRIALNLSIFRSKKEMVMIN